MHAPEFDYILSRGVLSASVALARPGVRVRSPGPLPAHLEELVLGLGMDRSPHTWKICVGPRHGSLDMASLGTAEGQRGQAVSSSCAEGVQDVAVPPASSTCMKASGTIYVWP